MKKYLSLLLPLTALGAATFIAVAADGNKKQAKPDEVEKVKAALPAEAPAKPKKKRELLVYSKTAGFRHSSIEIGAEAMRLMGEKTGAFNVTWTEDPAEFDSEKLSKYDAVLFLNTTGDCLRATGIPNDPAAQKTAADDEARRQQNLVDFVKKGKGLAGIHSATDTYAGWKEYHDMMGGIFDGHPWHELVAIKNMAPDNAINKPFEGKGFTITDEIYQFRDGSFSAKEHNVLLALDKNGTKIEKGKFGPDALYPISYLRKYGEGRTFYCSLGHREEIYWNPTILKHYLAGLQFVLGDLEANATPAQP